MGRGRGSLRKSSEELAGGVGGREKRGRKKSRQMGNGWNQSGSRGKQSE